MFLQDSYVTGTPWPREGCPHLQSGLIAFESVFQGLQTGATATLTTDKPLVLLGPCSVPNGVVLKRIHVQSGTTLVFDDQNIDLHVEEILVDLGGALSVGSETCRLYSHINITFYGSKASSTKINFDSDMSKVNSNNGALWLFLLTLKSPKRLPKDSLLEGRSMFTANNLYQLGLAYLVLPLPVLTSSFLDSALIGKSARKFSL